MTVRLTVRLWGDVGMRKGTRSEPTRSRLSDTQQCWRVSLNQKEENAQRAGAQVSMLAGVVDVVDQGGVEQLCADLLEECGERVD